MSEIQNSGFTEFMKAYIKGNKALNRLAVGDYHDVEKDFNDVFRFLEEAGDSYGISDYLWQLSKLHENQGQVSKAIKVAKESYELALQTNLKKKIVESSLRLSQLFELENNETQALNYYKLYILYNDSLLSKEATQRIADLRTEFEVGQKQAEVDLLTAEKKTQQIMMSAIAAFAIVLIILASIIYKYYQAKAKINVILASQKEDLERLNETKDKFFSIISHDLRGPISAFQGVGKMIKFAVEHKNQDYLLELSDDIDDSAARLSSLLDGLLSWALQQQGHFPNVPEKLHLNDIILRLIGVFKNTATSKGILLIANLKEEVFLWSDKNTSETIIRNLLNNALKFTPEGGEVSVSASVKEEHALIQISDTGVGIPQEKLNRLFNLNEKKSTYGTSGEKGLGLGLQLVYEFIEMNHGSIHVESEEGVGTTFFIMLPLFEEYRLQESIIE